jgi:hypothetical protein
MNMGIPVHLHKQISTELMQNRYYRVYIPNELTQTTEEYERMISCETICSSSHHSAQKGEATTFSTKFPFPFPVFN